MIISGEDVGTRFFGVIMDFHGTKTPARCDTITEPFDLPGCPVPVVRQSFGDVHGLPDPEAGTIYIVSMPVAQAVGRSRDDVFVPGEQIRDETGRIVGCRSIALLSDPRRERRVMYSSSIGELEHIMCKNMDDEFSFSSRHGISVEDVNRMIAGDLFTAEEARRLSQAIGYDHLFIAQIAR